MFGPSENPYRIVFVHRETCPYCRSMYAPLMEGIAAARKKGVEVEVITLHKVRNKAMADRIAPTVPALFRVDKAGDLQLKHVGRRTPENIEGFIVYGKDGVPP